jgi:thymidine kinase
MEKKQRSSTPAASRRLGEITVIHGPMFAGKSTELRRLICRAQQKKRCIVFKHKADTRYGTDDRTAKTHNGDGYEVHAVATVKDIWNAISDDGWSEVIGANGKSASKPDVVGIDEGQFFPGLLAFCLQLVQAGHDVIVAGLDTDKSGKVFQEIANLTAHAEHDVKLKAICQAQGCDSENAIYSHQFATSLPPPEGSPVAGQEIQIGGAEMYMALCRKCYTEARAKLQSPVAEDSF